jgi:hypothetical protein
MGIRSKGIKMTFWKSRDIWAVWHPLFFVIFNSIKNVSLKSVLMLMNVCLKKVGTFGLEGTKENMGKNGNGTFGSFEANFSQWNHGWKKIG